MKIRQSFVSNSSSCSFIMDCRLKINLEDINFQKILKTIDGCLLIENISNNNKYKITKNDNHIIAVATIDQIEHKKDIIINIYEQIPNGIEITVDISGIDYYDEYFCKTTKSLMDELNKIIPIICNMCDKDELNIPCVLTQNVECVGDGWRGDWTFGGNIATKYQGNPDLAINDISKNDILINIKNNKLVYPSKWDEEGY